MKIRELRELLNNMLEHVMEDEVFILNSNGVTAKVTYVDHVFSDEEMDKGLYIVGQVIYKD